MVSHPETGSDSPIGSDRESGRDINCRFVARLWSIVAGCVNCV